MSLPPEDTCQCRTVAVICKLQAWRLSWCPGWVWNRGQVRGRHTRISRTAWLPSKLPSRVTSGHTFTAVFSLKSYEVKVLHYIFPDVQVTSGAAPRSRWGLVSWDRRCPHPAHWDWAPQQFGYIDLRISRLMRLGSWAGLGWAGLGW